MKSPIITNLSILIVLAAPRAYAKAPQVLQQGEHAKVFSIEASRYSQMSDEAFRQEFTYRNHKGEVTDLTQKPPTPEQLQRWATLDPKKDGVMGTGTDRAYIFCDRINAIAHRTGQRVDVILGRVLAHEVGHLMLGRGHTSAGIMQARLNYSSPETPTFSPGQGNDIRYRLTRSESDK